MKLMHFTAKWGPFCPAADCAFELFREKHPRIQTESIDIDDDPETRKRYHVEGVPSDIIIGGHRPLHGACYTVEEFDTFWRLATEKSEEVRPVSTAKKEKKPPVKKAPVKKNDRARKVRPS